MDPTTDAPGAGPTGYRCFRLSYRTEPGTLPRLATGGLPDRAAHALAVLVPLLGCGEEAAAMAFDTLAGRADDGGAMRALAAIADEERVHDALLRQLCAALPAATGIDDAVAASRRFHIRLCAGGGAAHLARIAALDSAVCTILSRLTDARGVIARDPAICSLLRRIRDDEARHVAVSRRLALAGGDPVALRDVAATAREALANILGLAGDAFDTLGVDPGALDRTIRKLPDGLLRA